jgi:ribulose-phosphate 3-epimerase
VQEVHARGRRAGVCLNPATPASALDEILGELDQVKVMSVNPGWSGQRFIPEVLPKVERLRSMIDVLGLATEIEMDGGDVRNGAGVRSGRRLRAWSRRLPCSTSRASVAENMGRLKQALAKVRGA